MVNMPVSNDVVNLPLPKVSSANARTPTSFNEALPQTSLNSHYEECTDSARQICLMDRLSGLKVMPVALMSLALS